MAITITNVNSLALLNILNKTQGNQATTLQRLSTGLRINAGKDDPAGLIAAKSIQQSIKAVDASISNNQRADALLGVADKAIGQVSDLLDTITGLAVQSANKDGLTQDEIAANQSQIDEAIDSIDRIVNTTEFNGKKLLNGSLSVATSGVDTTKIADLHVYRRSSSNLNLSVDVASAATKGSFTLATTSASSATSLSITGAEGTAVIDIKQGEALSSIAAKINSLSSQTGVAASATSGNLTVLSSDYGSDQFVRTSVLSGDTTDYAANSAQGTDAKVFINGARAAVDGLHVNYSGNGVSASFNLTEGYNNGTVTGAESFTINASGGATFQLGTTSNTQASIGIDGMFSQGLGSQSLGYLSQLKSGGTYNLIDDPNQAASIAKEAAKQVAQIRGRLGGFEKFNVATALGQANASKESLTSALSTVQDADYATETAELNKQNVLLQSATSLLSVANQQTSNILSLLRG